MLTVASIFFWACVAYGALTFLGFIAWRFLQVDRRRQSVHFVETKDRWRLALSRHPAAEPRAGALPVLLCPGMGASGAIFEIGEGSLARGLSARGYDVWLLDPRGRGDSARPRWGGEHRYTWTIDDQIESDLPTALEAICEQTGSPRVHLVGFGAGALAAYPLLAGPGAERVQSAVVVAGAAFFARQQEVLSPRLLRLLGLIRPRLLLRICSPLLGRIDLPPLKRLQQLDNVDGRVYRRALVNAVFNLSRREISQLARWIERDRYCGADDEPDYRELLAQIGTPLLFVAGPRDRIAPPSMVQATADACSSASERRVLVAGRHEGMSCNYGHLDLLIGRGVTADLLPPLERWLDEHGSSRGASSTTGE